MRTSSVRSGGSSERDSTSTNGRRSHRRTPSGRQRHHVSEDFNGDGDGDAGANLWYYVDASDVRHGPALAAELLELVDNGSLGDGALAWTDGQDSWLELAEVVPMLREEAQRAQ